MLVGRGAAFVTVFQFSPSRGGRLPACHGGCRPHLYFNSRPRVEGVQNIQGWAKNRIISILALAWRASHADVSVPSFVLAFQFSPSRGGRHIVLCKR